MLLAITWEVSPEILHLGPLSIRWYGLMWALGFLLGYLVERKIYRNEKLPDEYMEKLLLYMIIGTVIGARIGHCVFYDWDYYSHHLLEIVFPFKIYGNFFDFNWKFIGLAGLASHGGAIGILIALWIYYKRVLKTSYLWTLDRVVIAVALCGACIRFGNLMNHEIYGYPTDVPWAFRFITNLDAWQAGAQPVFSLASHPTQIYEMLYCLVTFAVTLFMYWKTKAAQREGLIFGVFLVGIFFTRFLLEFIKEDQVGFEATMTLNMGQWLSIPFFLFGFFLIIRALYKKPEFPEVVKNKK